jgi:PAS domain S-box-containing protein
MEWRARVGLLVLSIVLLVVVASFVFLSLNAVSSSRVVNFAGRERMLSQWLTREALLIRFQEETFPEARRPEALRSQALVFEKVLRGLIHGDKELGLPPCSDARAKERLLQAWDLWRAFREHIESDDTNMAETDVTRLVALSDDLLRTLDEAVFFLSDHYQQRARLHQAALGAFVAVGAIVAVLVVMQYRRLTLQIRRARDIALRSRRKLRHIIDSAGEAIISVNERGQVDEFNPAAEKMFGWRREEMIGRSVGILMPERLRPHHDQGLQRFLRTRKRNLASWRNVEGIGLRKSGEEFPLELSFSMLESGGDLTITAVIRDVTDQRRASEELKRLNDRLRSAAQVAQRLALKAQVANRAKSAFLANMSHEIRTPLNAIIGLTSLLMDSQLSAEQREYCETLRKSADGLLGIINDILDFSKIESGRLELERRSFDLLECVEEAVEIAGAQRNDHGPDLVLIPSGELPRRVVGDPTRLRQILVNLLSNAIKFTKDGHVAVRIEARPDHQKTGRSSSGSGASGFHAHRVHFRVEDTGIGIPKDRVRDLFRPFTQLDASTTRRYGGTGLGLAICKRLCELMGGRIGVQSQVGKGSVFSFHVRLDPEETKDSVQKPGYFAGKTALFVDDCPASREFFLTQAESLGIRATVEADPQRAVERLAAGETFDVIIADYEMQGTGGIDFLRAASRHLRPGRTSILLSGYASARTKLGTLEGDSFETHGFLVKPLVPSRFQRTLERVLAERQARPDTPGQKPTFDRSLAHRTPLRILVAEDNPVNQLVIRRILQRLGYDPCLVATGLEVLKAMESQEYDVILMDVEMPELDGLEATRRLRASGPSQTKPWVIAMTAHATEEFKEKCVQAGMNDYVPKPVRIPTLTAALSRAAEHIGRGVSASEARRAA